MTRTIFCLLASSAMILVGVSLRGEEPAPPKSAPKVKPVQQSAPVVKTVPAIRIAPAIALNLNPAQDESKALKDRATHKEIQSIVIKGKAKNHTLQTFCVSPEGNLLAAVGPPKGYSGAKNGTESAGGEIQVFDGEGKALNSFSVPFPPQSINVNNQGRIFVAGDGKIASFDAQGKLLASADAPHLADSLKDAESLRKQAREQIEEQKKSYVETLDSLKEQLAELKAAQEQEQQAKEKDAQDKDSKEKADAEKSADPAVPVKKTAAQLKAEKQATANKRKLQQLESTIKTYETMVKSLDKQNLNATVESLTSRLRIINSLAVSDTEVFYTCGETKGYGYALWRASYDFQEPKKIASGLSGCCGQMDIQCCEGEIFVAENSRHRIVRYDREGKNLGSFGNSVRATVGSNAAAQKAVDKASQFGGCCNPMNIRFTSDGSVLTAESEGYVKLFSSEGKFVSVVGVAAVSGGCKNVAVGVSPKGDRVYFYDLGGSRIIVLAKAEPAKATAAAK